MIKIGVCGGPDKAPVVKALGFDYMEESMFRIASLSEQEFAENARRYEALGLPVYALNCFFGGDMTIYGEHSLNEVRAYVNHALKRAHALGGRICVIGSGKARAIPDGVSHQFAKKRFADVVSVCGEVADRYGIRIAIEPLNSRETNFINTVNDSAEIAKLTGRQNVGSLVDFFHFCAEGERDTGVINNADTLIHAHVARPDRYAPRLEDVETVSHWIGLLRRIGYEGGLSVESKFADFEADIAEAKKCLDRIAR